MKKDICNIWCAPLIIYLILSTIIIVLTFIRKDYMINSMYAYTVNNILILLLSQVISVLVWSIFMGWLCKTCHEGWAWFILFLPVLLGILIIILTTIFVDSININLNVSDDIGYSLNENFDENIETQPEKPQKKFYGINDQESLDKDYVKPSNLTNVIYASF